jgi:predicted ester cyclase
MLHGRSTTWHGLAESTRIKATRSVSVIAGYVPGCPEPMRGPAGYLAIIRMMRGGFPDIHWTLEEMVAEGDMVAARFIMRARIGAPAAI